MENISLHISLRVPLNIRATNGDISVSADSSLIFKSIISARGCQIGKLFSLLSPGAAQFLKLCNGAGMRPGYKKSLFQPACKSKRGQNKIIQTANGKGDKEGAWKDW
jgi:hypothetical protein